ncbi:acyltransferase family protein [Deinococcus aquiradiocola]|uniref:acyltransferase family protein n=1 Tax=Deinococcus aquiradiocola TaxID=393059 RepID=UPI00166A9BD7|nr:acyltransferase [Deinococcus aquiradiocola]
MPASPPPPTSSTASVASGRLAWVDVCRGLTVLLVVVHHVSGANLDRAPEGSALHVALLVVNRVTQFVVPTFLFLSALVFARSSSVFSWRRYLGSRARQLLWPYVLWTALYLTFKVVTGAGPGPGERLAAFWDPGLLHGKGYFHLYYLLLALQVTLLLPLLRRLNRLPWPLWAVLAGAAAVQSGVYALNLRVWHLESVGSLALWYVLPLVAGTALGARPERFTDLWARRGGQLTVACAVALAVYLPLGAAQALGRPLNVLAYTAGNWAYTLLAAVVMGGLSVRLARAGGALAGHVRPLLARLGQFSLQVYLLHPLLLWTFDRLASPGSALLQVPLVALYVVLGTGVPLAVARWMAGRPMSVWLFGR